MAHPLPPDRNSSLSELFDTATMPPGDRLRLLQDAMGRAAVPVEIQHHVGLDEVSARGAGARLGRLSILTVTTTPLTVRRTVRLARADPEPSVVVELQLAGRRCVVQYNRRIVLSPGDLVLLDAGRPYLSTSLEGSHQHSVRIPRADLALTDQALARVAGVRLGPRNAVVNLAAAYLSRLVGDHRLATEADLDVFEAPTIELIRAVVATQLGDATHFSRTFREAFGMSPREWRALHQNKHRAYALTRNPIDTVDVHEAMETFRGLLGVTLLPEAADGTAQRDRSVVRGHRDLLAVHLRVPEQFVLDVQASASSVISPPRTRFGS